MIDMANYRGRGMKLLLGIRLMVISSGTGKCIHIALMMVKSLETGGNFAF
jgi:hypothetical protein